MSSVLDASTHTDASDTAPVTGDGPRRGDAHHGGTATDRSDAAARRPIVAPFALSRTGGLPADALDGLIAEHAHRAAAAILAGEDTMEELAAPVADALHALVPALDDDPDLRRTALRLRRDVHNGRPTKQRDEDVEAVAERLGDHDAGRLARWIATADALRRGREALPDLLDDEIARARAHATATLLAPDVARGVALGSPTFLDGLRRRGTGATPGGRASRTAVGYLTRIAVKTSPFSSFTTVGLSGIGEDVGSGEEHRATRPSVGVEAHGRADVLAAADDSAVVRRAAPARALAVVVLLACAAHEDTAGALDYEPTRGLLELDGDPTLIEPDYAVVDGFAWRGETFSHAGVLDEDLAVLRGVGRSSYADTLARLGGEAPHEALRRLVDLGLLRPVAPWDEADDAPLPALVTALRNHGTALAAAVADDLHAVHRHAVDLAGLAGPDRAAAVRGTRSGARAAIERVGAIAPAWIDDAAVVYEDVRTAGPAARLPDALAEDLATIGEALRPDVVRTHLLRHLTDRFAALHGAGGVCDDVLAFLVGAGRGAEARAGLGAALQADARPRPEDAWGPVAATTAPPAVNVAFQVVAEDEGAVARGEHLVVLNHHGPGTGAALARFRTLLGDEGLDRGLRDWADALFPDAVPHVLDHGADWTDLQSAPLGLLPTLRWPGELPTTGDRDGLDLRDLRLVHDARTDALVFRDRAGRAIAPLYLGSVPQHLLTGPVRLLMTIADPWGCVSTLGKVDRSWRGIAPLTGDVVRQPRETAGRVVLRRANWRIRAALWPRPAAGEREDELLLRLERWRREHDLPMEGFVTFERPGGGAVREATQRKPRWIRFDSPHAVHQASAGLDDGVLAVRFVEALPGRGQHWSPGAPVPHAEEHVALLRWGRS